MLNNLRKAIINGSKNITNLTGRIFYVQAKEKTLYPYKTFHFITNTLERDSIDKYENVIVQMNIYDDNNDPARLETIIEDIKKIYDDAEKTLTISGNYIFISIKRQWIRPIQKVNDVWQAVLQYKFEIQVLENI